MRWSKLINNRQACKVASSNPFSFSGKFSQLQTQVWLRSGNTCFSDSLNAAFEATRMPSSRTVAPCFHFPARVKAPRLRMRNAPLATEMQINRA